MVRGVGCALRWWKLRDPPCWSPERLGPVRVRVRGLGPDGQRGAGGDGAVWPGAGPGRARRPGGPDPVVWPGGGRGPAAAHTIRRAWVNPSHRGDAHGAV